MRYKFTPIELRLDMKGLDTLICVQWNGLRKKWILVGEVVNPGLQGYDTQAQAEDAALELAKQCKN